MYGKKRIVLSGSVAAHTGCFKVYQKGSDGRGGSSHPLGIWYRDQMGTYWADLKSPDQGYKLVSSTELDIKGFGGCKTKTELRNAIISHRKRTGQW